jgi:large subunit ribosomal protein L7A
MEVFSLLSQLKTAAKVVGVKQLKKALREGQAAHVFVAEDAEPRVTAPVIALAKEAGVDLTMVPTMKELGQACQIEVGAAVAGIVG